MSVYSHGSASSHLCYFNPQQKVRKPAQRLNMLKTKQRWCEKKQRLGQTSAYSPSRKNLMRSNQVRVLLRWFFIPILYEKAIVRWVIVTQYLYQFSPLHFQNTTLKIKIRRKDIALLVVGSYLSLCPSVHLIFIPWLISSFQIRGKSGHLVKTFYIGNINFFDQTKGRDQKDTLPLSEFRK